MACNLHDCEKPGLKGPDLQQKTDKEATKIENSPATYPHRALLQLMLRKNTEPAALKVIENAVKSDADHNLFYPTRTCTEPSRTGCREDQEAHR